MLEIFVDSGPLADLEDMETMKAARATMGEAKAAGILREQPSQDCWRRYEGRPPLRRERIRFDSTMLETSSATTRPEEELDKCDRHFTSATP